MGEKDQCLFLIVNVVYDNNCLELYIGVEFGNKYVGEVFECVCQEKVIYIFGGYGEVYL